jgi:hypothetical protein
MYKFGSHCGEDGEMISKIVLSMALLRVLSGSIELIAALLIYRFNNVEKALLINSSLALVGPIIFISITALGLVGITDKLSFGKLAWVALGVTCLLIGIFKK